MKVFVVLAIAVFTSSCQANHDVLDFSDFDLQSEELLSEDYYQYDLWKEQERARFAETPMGKFIASLSKEAEQLKARVEQSLDGMMTKLQPYADEVSKDVHSQVKELKKDISSYTDMLAPENLHQNLKKSLKKSVSNLQSQLNTYTDDLKQKAERSLKEVQKGMVPLTQNFQTQLTEVAQDLQKNVVSFGEGIGQSVANQLTSFWEAIWE